MDSYVDLLQSHGASLVMIGKGNRSQQVTDACRRHGAFYLGSIGGPAAVLARDCINKVECIDYPELGMEAVWRIEVVDLPTFILVDGKGNAEARSGPTAETISASDGNHRSFGLDAPSALRIGWLLRGTLATSVRIRRR